jgi:hypothetical protein
MPRLRSSWASSGPNLARSEPAETTWPNGAKDSGVASTARSVTILTAASSSTSLPGSMGARRRARLWRRYAIAISREAEEGSFRTHLQFCPLLLDPNRYLGLILFIHVKQAVPFGLFRRFGCFCPQQRRFVQIGRARATSGSRTRRSMPRRKKIRR